MIPKKIHYCWFGGKPLPEEYKKNIESWKKHMPDYEIIRWDETNYDINKNPYTKYTYENKKWAFLTDYARLDIIYNNGGLYFDTDVEVIKSFDDLLNNKAFMGVECGGYVATGLGFGAEKGHHALKMNMDCYTQLKVEKDGSITLINCPLVTTKLFNKYGLNDKNTIHNVLDVAIYPTEYFCPMDYKTGVINITQNTYSIHKYSYSWGSYIDKQWVKYNQLKHKHFMLRILYPLVCLFYFYPVKIINNIINKGLIKTLSRIIKGGRQN